MNAPAKIKSDGKPAKRDPNPAPNPAEQLMQMAAPDMAAVDALIIERMQSPVGMIPDLADHLVAAGGKRLRPLLTIACARLCNYQCQHHHSLAAAVEFIHSATLLHDDVVDGSGLRRGRKAANLIWGNSASILVGDFLFARAFKLMVETGSLDALGILAGAASVIAEGEVHQLAAMGDLDLSEAAYMDIIGAKTAALFAAACEVAPVISEGSAEQRSALQQYGYNLGMAFQLVDDALDYGGFETALGKAVGDDFREGKLTLPVIRALDGAGPETRAFWMRVMIDKKQEPADFERAVSLLRQSGALQASVDLARSYAYQARQNLDGFPANPWRQHLQWLADYVVDRVS